MTFPNTKRLTFGEFSKEDAELLFQLNGNPDVMKYITLGKPMTLSEVKTRSIPRIMKSYTYEKDFGIFPARLIESGDYIGWFQFEPDHEIESAIEIGWRLKKEYWGNGYATEGAKLLVEMGKQMNRKIVARAMSENKESIRVMEKAGLKFVEEFWDDYEPRSSNPDVLYELK